MSIAILFVGLALAGSALVGLHDAIAHYAPKLFTAAKRRLTRPPILGRKTTKIGG